MPTDENTQASAQKATEQTVINLPIAEVEEILRTMIDSPWLHKRVALVKTITDNIVRPKKLFYDQLIEDSTLRLLTVLPKAFKSEPTTDGSPGLRVHTAHKGQNTFKVEYFVNQNKTVHVCFSVLNNLTQSTLPSIFRLCEKPSTHDEVEKIVRQSWSSILPPGYKE